MVELLLEEQEGFAKEDPSTGRAFDSRANSSLSEEEEEEVESPGFPFPPPSEKSLLWSSASSTSFLVSLYTCLRKSTLVTRWKPVRWSTYSWTDTRASWHIGQGTSREKIDLVIISNYFTVEKTNVKTHLV